MSDHPNIPAEQLDVIFYHGAYPLWKYLQEVMGINIVDVCARVTKDEPILKTTNGQLVARVVDLPHSKELDHTFNNDVIFIVNSINVVFESLKAGIEKDGIRLLDKFKFKLDSNQNMYLVDTESNESIGEKAIAIIKNTL